MPINLFTVIGQIKTPGSAADKGAEIASSGGSKIIQMFIWLLDKAPLFFGALAVVFITFILAKITKNTVIKSLSKHNTDDQVVLLVGKVSYLCMMIVGFTVALEIIGIDISPIVGLVGLGFGFAIQDIIKNFVSGALILIQEPFKIGDVIKAGEYIGKVEAIEARSTNIKTFNGQRVIIPNADMFSNSVTNFSSHPERRLEIVVGVHYDTNLNEAMKILSNVMSDHTAVLETPAPTTIFSEFGDSAINISAKFWVDKDSKIFAIRSELISQIKVAFDNANISIPYPIRTLDMPIENNKDIFQKEEKTIVSPNEIKTPKMDTINMASQNPFTVETAPEEQNIQTPFNHAEFRQDV